MSKKLIATLPKSSLPRERLIEYGEQALSNQELLAILLRTGSAPYNVMELSGLLLAAFPSLYELKAATLQELQMVRGVGKIRAIELKAMMEFVRDGDTIFIESISRLARNTLDFLKIVEELTQKKVGLISLKENIDTSTPQGRFMLSVFSALSQMERETIRQRQREGIDLALATGKKFGRPRIQMTDQYIAIHKKWKAGEITATMAMQLLGMKRNTFYKLAGALAKNTI